MMRPPALQSSAQLFDAVDAVAIAQSLEDKNRAVEQCCERIADGAWMDARLEFVFTPVSDGAPVEITLTAEEYMLLSWDLPQLAMLMDKSKETFSSPLPHLLHLKNFSYSRGQRPAQSTSAAQYANVFEHVQLWSSRLSHFTSHNTPLTPWKVLCGRELTRTENTALEIAALQRAWPLMDETHLEGCYRMCTSEHQRKTIIESISGNRVMARVEQSAVGTLVMLMGFTPQSRQHPDYLKILSTLTPESQAVLEKWRLTQSLDNTQSASVSAAQKRKM